MVLTDSGGLQEETTALGVPCLTLRENTERPITIELGTNELVGTNMDYIMEKVSRMVSGQYKRKSSTTPILWDGHSSERIVKVLKNYLKT